MARMGRCDQLALGATRIFGIGSLAAAAVTGQTRGVAPPRFSSLYRGMPLPWGLPQLPGTMWAVSSPPAPLGTRCVGPAMGAAGGALSPLSGGDGRRQRLDHPCGRGEWTRTICAGGAPAQSDRPAELCPRLPRGEPYFITIAHFGAAAAVCVHECSRRTEGVSAVDRGPPACASPPSGG